MSTVSSWNPRITIVAGLAVLLFLLLDVVDSRGETTDPPFVA